MFIEADGAIGKPHTEATLHEMQQPTLNPGKGPLSERGEHFEEYVVEYYNGGDRVKHWGKMGTFWGGIWGLLFGSMFFAIPDFGVTSWAGTMVGPIMGALQGAVVAGGLSVICSGIYSLWIPKDSILQYELARDPARLIDQGQDNDRTPDP